MPKAAVLRSKNLHYRGISSAVMSLCAFTHSGFNTMAQDTAHVMFTAQNP